MTDSFAFQEHRRLSELSTFGIGGTARYFIAVHEVDQLQEILKKCHKEGLHYLVIGKGSNCLFDDRGFDGLLILNRIDFMEKPAPGVFYVGAGYSFSLLGVQTAREGWSGLEFASGIPGSVGGAVFMNAGANGSETAQTLVSVDFVTDNGEWIRFLRKDLDFRYRYSPFHDLKGVITGATFALTAMTDARKKQLEIIDYRKKTQPYGAKSAGCVFRNPSNGSAGALIDQQGLKGMSVGRAKVSEMHANFIVNEGGASSEDVLKLIAAIQNKVKENTGIELESEVRFIPYSRDFF